MCRKSLLKKIWNLAPPALRQQYFRILMGRKFAQIERRPCAGPLYIAGAFRSASGIGNGARLYMREMEKVGQAIYCLDLTKEMRMACELPLPKKTLLPESLADRRGGTLILHANPPQFQLALMALPSSFLRHVHIRAYWAWELEKLPKVWLQALPYVDSIECPSHFCRQTFAQYAQIPVTVHAHAVPERNVPEKTYCRDGILRCLCVFDAGSSFERKNPQAVLEAFNLAFREGEAELTFKITHAQADMSAYRRFRERCAEIAGVRIIDQLMTENELDDLYRKNDLFISLHRSEGYGLGIREAMSYSLHVLATGWSGNMDFMKGELCHIAPYKLVRKHWHKGPMSGLSAHWAEADVEASAKILREIRQKLLEHSQ